MGAAIAFDCACSVLLSQLVRLRRSSALCGCPSCLRLELDQAENNPRVTLLPLRVTDRDQWEKGDDIPRVQEKIMAKPQKILCFVQRQRKKRFLLPKDTRKLVVIDEEEPEAPAPSFFLFIYLFNIYEVYPVRGPSPIAVHGPIAVHSAIFSHLFWTVYFTTQWSTITGPSPIAVHAPITVHGS